MILKPVYNKVFEIEKHKNNPNYEGNLKELPPQVITHIFYITHTLF